MNYYVNFVINYNIILIIIKFIYYNNFHKIAHCPRCTCVLASLVPASLVIALLVPASLVPVLYFNSQTPLSFR